MSLVINTIPAGVITDPTAPVPGTQIVDPTQVLDNDGSGVTTVVNNDDVKVVDTTTTTIEPSTEVLEKFLEMVMMIMDYVIYNPNHSEIIPELSGSKNPELKNFTENVICGIVARKLREKFGI